MPDASQQSATETTAAPAAAVVPDDKAAPKGAVPASDAKPDAGTQAASILGAGDVPADTAAAPQDWPNDWRERHARNISGKDEAAYEKALGRLKRFASPDNVVRSLFEADAKIRSGQYKRALPKDATPEEVSAFRKELGIPETADKYQIALPETIKVGDADKEVLEHFKAVFHDRNVHPDDASGIVAEYYGLQQQAAEAAAVRARDVVIQNQATLRAEYGADFGRNMTLAKTWLAQVAGGDEGRNALADLPLSDGTRLGDHPGFVRMAVAAALANADDGALAVTEFAAGGVSIEQQFNDAIQLKFSDPIKYATDAHQDKLRKLGAAMERKGSKAA